ncbi:hypothetical protein C2E23DRAFT_848046 [Lenzites betulinus]|nr:hypothetical protein C2E23DRAFT_848046 [Lenzites betulinus]
MTMLHKTASSSSPPSKSRAHAIHLRLSSDPDDANSRKNRQYGHTSRNAILSQLDLWLSGSAPAVVRPWVPGTPSLATLVLGYCLFSILAFSSYMCCSFWGRSFRTNETLDLSVLKGLPVDHLLFKVSSSGSLPPVLSTNVLATLSENPVFSAALWTTEEGVEHIESWAAEWRGPISLLVTTTAVPSSPEHLQLVAKLTAIQRKHPPLKHTFFVHFLHLPANSDMHPNMFLNLARFLAPSPRVVLFPSNLTSVPPKTLYRTLLHQQPTLSSAMSSEGRTRKRRPGILTNTEQTSFPFAPLAPVVIARDDATWCTERFFANMSRTADWEECLWQVWLANFGDLEVRQVADLSTDGADMSENTVTVRVLNYLLRSWLMWNF